MVVKKEYVLELVNTDTSTEVMTFTFKSTIEVKNFLKNLSGSHVVSDSDYTCKLYERTIQWDLSEGTFYDSMVQITQDL